MFHHKSLIDAYNASYDTAVACILKMIIAITWRQNQTIYNAVVGMILSVTTKQPRDSSMTLS